MIVIFGQQDYAERLDCYLKESAAGCQIKTIAFPIANQDPARYMFDFSHYDAELSVIGKNIPIFVAFGAKCREKAAEHLMKQGFADVRLYDAEMDNELKKIFFKKEFAAKKREFSLINEEKTALVYMAKHVLDKPLNHYPASLSHHIIPIQVGADLTDKRIADLADNTGDNISDRNRHFSETTALYWMWKNAEADYLGLCHYRRLWKDLDFIVERLLQNNAIDVVLPLPTLSVPSVCENYMKKYIPDVYPTMLDVLQEMSPEYYKASKEIYSGRVFYACNMLIAKRNVLHGLCQWMFPMVFEIEKRIGDLADSYQNRYAGFCTEQLITLYFLYNKEKWKITHADKIFIE